MVAALMVIGAFALVAAIVWWLRRSYVLVHVSGRSMEPTLTNGQRVPARRTGLRRVRHGDVVVLYPPPGTSYGEGLLVKRILALPGDPVPRARVPMLRDLPGEHIPPDHLVVLGDNPAWSMDSRQLGLFPADRLLGVVLRHRRADGPSGHAPDGHRGR
jgi:signal peptidase I